MEGTLNRCSFCSLRRTLTRSIRSWFPKVEQEREDGQNHAGGVQAALLRRKDEVLRKEDQARRNPVVHVGVEVDRERELRAQMAGMAMTSRRPIAGRSEAEEAHRTTEETRRPAAR